MRHFVRGQNQSRCFARLKLGLQTGANTDEAHPAKIEWRAGNLMQRSNLEKCILSRDIVFACSVQVHASETVVDPVSDLIHKSLSAGRLLHLIP